MADKEEELLGAGLRHGQVGLAKWVAKLFQEHSAHHPPPGAGTALCVYRPYRPMSWPSARTRPFMAPTSWLLVAPGARSSGLAQAENLKEDRCRLPRRS